jgi:8-amino-7-oxononanoate synthase
MRTASEPGPLVPVSPTEVEVEGRRLTYFGGCDYFRLSHHPEVLAAARDALRGGEMNVSASRLTTGNRAVYAALESELARFFRVDDALLTATGYLSNLVLAQGCAGRFDRILLDERAHGSLVDAAGLLGVPVTRFRHRDPVDVARRVRRWSGRDPARWVLMTDGWFPQEGAVAPLAGYVGVLPETAWLWVDDAHGAGTLGELGGGTLELEGVSRDRCIQTGTLSKAFGVYGGFVLAPRDWLDTVRRHSRIHVGGTPLSPALAEAARVAVRLLSGHPEWRPVLQDRSRVLGQVLEGVSGMPMPAVGPVLCVSTTDPARRDAWSRRLGKEGIFPSWIRYPGGAAEGFFRFAWSIAHTESDMVRLGRALACREDVREGGGAADLGGRAG